MSQQFLSSFRRHLSTTIAAKLSASSAKNKLLKTFDPDKALSIFASSTPSTSRSIRSALDLTVRRLAQARRFSEIDHLIQSHRNSHPTPHDEPFLSSLIISYGAANMLTNARLIFDELSNPTVVAFNAMLTACNRVKKPNLVSKLFDELRSKHSSISPNEVSYGILIKSKCMSGKVDKAVEVFKEMKEKDFKLSSIVYSTIIDGLYSKRKVEEAEKFWNEMVDSGLKPDLPAYNLKAMHHSSNGEPDKVMEVMKEIEEVGLKPDAISYNYLISCYCKNGVFEKAKESYEEFKRKKISPNAAIFKVLVRSLCENDDFLGAYEVWKDSMKCNKIPEFKNTKVLVEGLVKNGNVEEAKEVIRVVVERFPKDSVHGWKEVEKELGLCVDEEVCGKVEAA